MPDLALFAERMRYWCEEGNLGYSQTDRWNIREGGNCDCSSLVIHCLREAGFDTGSATYTGDLAENLTARGWERFPQWIASACPGDILLSEKYHVCAVVEGYGWNAKIAEAWLDENGGIYYGKPGDQTDEETRVRKIYVYPWDCILKYREYEEDDMQPSDLTNYTMPTVDEGNVPVWQVWAWTQKYAKETYYQISAMSAAVETLAKTKGADPYEIAKAVDKAVKDKLSALKAPDIDYDVLAKAIAANVKTGATAKEIADEIYKRMKA